MTKKPSSRLAVVSLRTHCLLETIHFYHDVIGLTFLSHHGHRPAFELGNDVHLVLLDIGGEVIPPAAPEPRFPMLAFAVPDLDQAVERLKAHNIPLPWGIESNPQVRWVEFHDPGGNLIELAQFLN